MVVVLLEIKYEAHGFIIHSSSLRLHLPICLQSRFGDYQLAEKR